MDSFLKQVDQMQPERISLCCGFDELAQGARHAISDLLRDAPSNTIVTSDDVIHWHQLGNSAGGFQNRQYRSALSPIRLFTRGGIGGLISLPIDVLQAEMLQNHYASLHGLKLDLALGFDNVPLLGIQTLEPVRVKHRRGNLRMVLSAIDVGLGSA